jgi:hypothetical protein
MTATIHQNEPTIGLVQNGGKIHQNEPTIGLVQNGGKNPPKRTNNRTGPKWWKKSTKTKQVVHI